MFDTAPAYGGPTGSELLLGNALRGERQRVVLATKFGFRIHAPQIAPGSRRNIRRELEQSLRLLQTDYLDLYYLHHVDPFTPIEETLSALDDLVHEGKLLYVGMCNMAAWQLVEAVLQARRAGVCTPIAAQNLYNLVDRSVERELLPACARYGVGLIAHTPLAGGLLSGKYRHGEPPPSGARLSDRLEDVGSETIAAVRECEREASEQGISLLSLAITALLAQPVVSSVIAGATSPEQVRANAANAELELPVQTAL